MIYMLAHKFIIIGIQQQLVTKVKNNIIFLLDLMFCPVNAKKGSSSGWKTVLAGHSWTECHLGPRVPARVFLLLLFAGQLYVLHIEDKFLKIFFVMMELKQRNYVAFVIAILLLCVFQHCCTSQKFYQKVWIDFVLIYSWICQYLIQTLVLFYILVTMNPILLMYQFLY